MTPYGCRITLAALLVGALSMAGCANKPATRPANSGATSGAHAATTSKSSITTATKPAGKPLPSSTGIPACDDYLASYVACHRAAGIYSPDQIDPHYQDMRTSLLRDSLDPTIRPQLGARCTSLALQLRQALHGKSCGTASASTASGS
jgi:hypothetical protein